MWICRGVNARSLVDPPLADILIFGFIYLCEGINSLGIKQRTLNGPSVFQSAPAGCSIWGWNPSLSSQPGLGCGDLRSMGWCSSCGAPPWAWLVGVHFKEALEISKRTDSAQIWVWMWRRSLDIAILLLWWVWFGLNERWHKAPWFGGWSSVRGWGAQGQLCIEQLWPLGISFCRIMWHKTPKAMESPALDEIAY